MRPKPSHFRSSRSTSSLALSLSVPHALRAAAWLVSAGALGALTIACSDRGAPTEERAQATVVSPSLASGRRAIPAPPPRADASMRGSVPGLMAGQGQADGAPALAADAAKAQEAVAAASAGAATSTVANVTAQTTRTSVSPSMVIRNGWAGIEVDSLDPAIAQVRRLAERVGGFVANTTIQGGRDQLRSASLEVKVPSARFDEALTGLSPIGKVESVNVTAEDVGEEYVDVAARVENARRLESRLIALLANRTGRLQDVLSVERELARVREEIERYEGRLRFLRTRVATSTLTVNVHERAPIITPVAGDGPITVALRAAWRNFVGFVAALIASLGILVPLGALALAGWLVVRRWVRWRPERAEPAPEAARS